MQSEYLSKTCLELQNKIDCGLIDIEDCYVEFITKMVFFINKLKSFAKTNSE